jgi:hypothetical protein
MQLLVAATEDYILSEETAFSADEDAGQTTISCVNASGFKVNDFVVLGSVGSEQAEIRRIATVSTDLLSFTIISATNFNHKKDDSIRRIRFDKRKFYRSTSEDGSYSHLSAEGSPVDINVDKPEGTEFEDAGGSSSSWYISTYYNSYTGVESSLSDSLPSKAGDAEHYTSIFKIKSEAGFTENPYITSEIVDRYRLEAESEAESAIAGVYSVPLTVVPKIFQHIVTLLAAGHLLAKEYGMENDTEIGKTGTRKIERAEELLEKIRNRELLLIDSTGEELDSKSVILASSSNTYNADKYNKGEMFTLEDEEFRMADPEFGNGATQ